jgi:hypothetical protein
MEQSRLQTYLVLLFQPVQPTKKQMEAINEALKEAKKKNIIVKITFIE